MSITNIAGGQMILNRPGGRVFFIGQVDQAYYNAGTPSDGNDGLTAQRPFATIQKGLDACVAGRGDTVALLPGYWTITAALTMTKQDVVLRAALTPLPLQRGNARIICTTDVSMLEIDSSDITIEGIYFDDDVATATADSMTVDVADTSDVNRLAMINCYFNMASSDSDRNCIRLGDGTKVAVNSVIEGCTFHAVDQDAIVISAGSDENLIRDCLIYDSVSTEKCRYGIYSTGDSCTFQSNVIDVGGTAAIYLAGNNNRLVDNRLSCTHADGICIVHAANTTYNKSFNNFLGAIAAGNLNDYTTACATGNLDANIAAPLWNATNPGIAVYDTPTVDGS